MPKQPVKRARAMTPARPQAKDAPGATRASHAHPWRSSFNPDGSTCQVCDCGARRDA